ncbi:phosphate system positive regulatory protein pho81 [Nowakowskiella sp. JEL0078]|nr:phosphate system positive regulatory protein pho81 [Nowakowskiella sp. JEL0078]
MPERESYAATSRSSSQSSLMSFPLQTRQSSLSSSPNPASLGVALPVKLDNGYVFTPALKDTIKTHKFPLSPEATILLIHHHNTAEDTTVALAIKDGLENCDEGQLKGWQVEIVNLALSPNFSDETLKRNYKVRPSRVGSSPTPPSPVYGINSSPDFKRSFTDINSTGSGNTDIVPPFIGGCRAIIYVISEDALNNIEETSKIKNFNLLLTQISQGLDLGESNIDVKLIPLLIGSSTVSEVDNEFHFNRFRRFDCDRFPDDTVASSVRPRRFSAESKLESSGPLTSVSVKTYSHPWARSSYLTSARQLMRRFFQLGHVDVDRANLTDALARTKFLIREHMSDASFPPANNVSCSIQSVFNLAYENQIFIEQNTLWNACDMGFATGNVCIIFGVQGIGKTFAAVEYLKRKVDKMFDLDQSSHDNSGIENLARRAIPSPGCHPVLYLSADTEERLGEGWLSFCQRTLRYAGGSNRHDSDPSFPTLTQELSTQSLQIIVQRLAPLLSRKTANPLLPAYILLDGVESWNAVRPFIEAFPTIKFILTTTKRIVVETSSMSARRTKLKPPTVLTMQQPTEREVYEFVQRSLIRATNRSFNYDDVRRIINLCGRTPYQIATAVKHLLCQLDTAGMIVSLNPKTQVTTQNYESAIVEVKLHENDSRTNISHFLYYSKIDTHPEIALGLQTLCHSSPNTYQILLYCAFFDSEFIFLDRITEFCVIHAMDTFGFDILEEALKQSKQPNVSAMSTESKLSIVSNEIRNHFWVISSLGLCHFTSRHMVMIHEHIHSELRHQVERAYPERVLELPDGKMRLLTKYHDELQSPLHLAISEGDNDEFNYLMSRTTKSNDNPIPVDVNSINAYLGTPLYDAISNRKTEYVAKLLANGANPSPSFLPYKINGGTLLHHAVRSGQLAICEMLLKRGVIENVLDRQGKTALDLAADANFQKIVEILLKYDAQIGFGREHFVVSLVRAETKSKFRFRRNTSTRNRKSMDFTAVTECETEETSASSIVRPNTLVSGNSVYSVGNTPLHIAAKSGSWPACLSALENGIDWKARNRSGNLALHVAWSAGFFELYHLLLDYGVKMGYVSINSTFESIWSNSTRLPLSQYHDDVQALPPLNLVGATRIPVVEAVKQLALIPAFSSTHNLLMLVHNRDANGATPLHHAASTGHEGLIQWLYDIGEGELDLDTIDFDGRTPFLVAVCSNQSPACNLLLDLGSAALGIPDASGKTPLYHAVARGFKALAKLLLDWMEVHDVIQGSNIRQKCITASVSEDGRTPLFAAALNGDVELGSLLIRSGAAMTIDMPDVNGESPLFAAVSAGHVDFVRLLLKNKSRVINNPKPGNFWTPLMCAAVRGFTEVVKALLELGSAIDGTDLEGRTPVYCINFF